MSVLSSSLSRRKFSFLGDRYINLKEIGFGGMGRVYEAYDQFLKIKVAIKVLSSNSASVRQIVRFQKEAKVVSRLCHQNIVKVLDFGMDTDNDLFLIMDFVDGMSLQEIIEQRGPLPLPDVIEIVSQVADALEHAHLKGVIHRDIKPHNIMVSHGVNGDFQVKLVDFGIAKVMTDDSGFASGGNSAYTPLYSSPEQINNSNLDIRADIYSLGCVMYFLLTGEPPFQGQNLLDTLDMHLNSERPGVNLKFAMPSEVEQVIDKALSINPQDRYQNIPEFQEDLDYLRDVDFDEVEKETDKLTRFEMNGSFISYVIRNWRASVVVMLLLASSVFWIAKCLIEIDHGALVPHTMSLSERKPKKFYRQDVGGVDTWHGGGSLTDEDLKFLAKSNAKGVNLQGLCISGEGLKYIAAKDLVSLSILDSELDSENYRYIGSLKKLNSLELNYSNIDDRALASMETLPSLKTLKLKGCSFITNRSLKTIAVKFPNLASLTLNFALVDGAGFKYLGTMPMLEVLYMADVDLADKDIAELAKYGTKIRSLDLSGSFRLTDQSLNSLSEMKELTSLSLRRCDNLSASAINKFMRANPRCLVALPDSADGLKDGEDVEKMIADFMDF